MIMRKFFFLLVFPLITACPDSDEDCDDIGRVANIPNLIQLTPMQDQYTQGEIITLKLEIPNSNSYFESNINFQNATGDDTGFLVLSAGLLLEDNDVNIVTGRQGGNFNWFIMPLNEQSDNYELELEITLNRLGSYYWQTEDVFSVNENSCNRYRVDTNVEWTILGEVEFEVIP